MLKYCMQILTKVSFDPLLFSKELKKALQWISKEEKVVLNRWLRLKFRKNPKDILGAEVEEKMEKSK
jgi:hypothetical protein